MKIHGLCIAHNEADVLGQTTRHLLEHGVDALTIINHRSTDGTAEVLEELGTRYPGRLEVWRRDDRYYRQQPLTNELAQAARAGGADWLLPFDADEYWIPRRHTTLRAAFASADYAGVDTLRARVYHHLSWRRRPPQAAHLPKVAIRATPVRHFLCGNHHVDPGGRQVDGELVEIRELSYRGEDHFVRKMRERIATLRPDSPPGENTHYKARVGLSELELREQWRSMQDAPSIVSPIPSRFVVGV
jgi:glycosyltransferase involved in cell wall biosynthesis